MRDDFERLRATNLSDDDRMGFAVPVTPTHSLMLLNAYMRTDLLLRIHYCVHQVRDADMEGSPIHHLTKALKQVLGDNEGGHPLQGLGRNPLHFDADREFVAIDDRLHDIRMMKHHLKCHRRTIRDIGRHR